MQPKLLIAIVLVFIGALAAFNVMKTSKVNASINETTAQDSAESKASTQSAEPKSTESKISDKPLAQQPKAMVDKAEGAAGDIEKAQQEQQQKMDELIDAQ